ncbi:MAG: polya polymerase [Bacillota bacterium]|nr:polya polymerase [Bacillota bacterium]
MKIFGIHNIKSFYQAVEECRGKVEIVTEAGDRLNLKSKLCQYVAMSEIFKDASIGSIEIEIEDPSDKMKILSFLMTEAD